MMPKNHLSTQTDHAAPHPHCSRILSARVVVSGGLGRQSSSHRPLFNCGSNRRQASIVRRSFEPEAWDSSTQGDVEAFDEAEQSATWDTRAVMLRVLTARAVQRSMMELQKHNTFAANWLNNYCIENPPLGGDEFLLKLFSQPAMRLYDDLRRGWVTINPQEISNNILEHRHRLARHLVQGFPEFVGDRNLQVLREHLESNTYTAGGHWSEPSPRTKKGGPTKQPGSYRT